MNNDLKVRSTSAETTLRPMHAGDLAAMHGLAQQMSWPHRAEDCAQLLALGAGTVAVDAKGVTVGVGLRWSFGRDVGTIGLVLVAPDQQGRGIGRALMKALIADLELAHADAERDGRRAAALREAGLRLDRIRPPAPGAAGRRRRPADRAGRPAAAGRTDGSRRSCAPSTPPSSAPTVRSSSAVFWRAGDAWLVDRAGQPAGFADPACLRPRHDHRARSLPRARTRPSPWSLPPPRRHLLECCASTSRRTPKVSRLG